MPTKSPAQKRLMQAAAHTKGGFGGVPQKVGKEFVSADKRLSKGNSMAKIKKMADGGVASLGGMTSSTPSIPGQQLGTPSPQVGMAQGGSQNDIRSVRQALPFQPNPADSNGLNSANPNSAYPVNTNGYKKGGHITTRRVSSVSRSKSSPSW